MFERFFYDDDGTLVDRTIEWSNPYSASGAWDAKSYLYCSSYLPFNHRYFDVATTNDKSGDLSVDIWYNSEWTAVVDIINDTVADGVSFGKSGIITFTPDTLKGWDIEDDSADITELSTKSIYNVYWMRFGYDAATDSNLVINHIGQKFCDDYALYSIYPLLNVAALKTQFETGKTDWVTQEISASSIIVSDLKRRNLAVSKNQVLDTKRFELPCIHKTAEIIFSGMGSSYVDDKNEARKAYDDAMNAGSFNIDVTKDGKADRVEQEITHRMMGR